MLCNMITEKDKRVERNEKWALCWRRWREKGRGWTWILENDVRNHKESGRRERKRDARVREGTVPQEARERTRQVGVGVGERGGEGRGGGRKLKVICQRELTEWREGGSRCTLCPSGFEGYRNHTETTTTPIATRDTCQEYWNHPQPHQGLTLSDPRRVCVCNKLPER